MLKQVTQKNKSNMLLTLLALLFWDNWIGLKLSHSENTSAAKNTIWINTERIRLELYVL